MGTASDTTTTAAATTGRQDTIVNLKGSAAFAAWVHGLAEAQGVPLTVLYDLAVRDYGLKCGAPPMPKRIPKRTPRRRPAAPDPAPEIPRERV